jgi:hypothetical protein
VRERMQLLHGPAVETLLALTELPEVIYLDPMFPHKQKSARRSTSTPAVLFPLKCSRL